MQSYGDFIRDQSRAPAIVAHRGAWHAAPENSMAAILGAKEAGYEIIEIDVQESSDGVLFLLHDKTLKRMAGRDEAAQSLSMADLAKTRLRARDGGHGALLTDQCIPTLEAVLTKARGRVYFDLDVKYPQHLSTAAALVARLGMTDQVNLKEVVQTKDAANGLRSREASHGVMVKPMTRFHADDVDFLFGLVRDLSPAMVETEFDQLETIAARASEFRQAGISIWVNTLDPVACGPFTDTNALTDPDRVWGTLIDAGISIFQTDEPEALRAYLDARQVTA